jgi:hypothetical protein
VRDEELIEQLREGLRRMSENPGELWDKLIQEGIIDEQGNVLVRLPGPPRKKRPKKAPKPTVGEKQSGDATALSRDH